jgi:hypothetical protein
MTEEIDTRNLEFTRGRLHFVWYISSSTVQLYKLDIQGKPEGLIGTLEAKLNGELVDFERGSFEHFCGHVINDMATQGNGYVTTRAPCPVCGVEVTWARSSKGQPEPLVRNERDEGYILIEEGFTHVFEDFKHFHDDQMRQGHSPADHALYVPHFCGQD